MKTNDKIRMLREERNWTQEDMANKLQMSINGYAKLERGESRLYIPKLEQIAEVFDIDILELMSFGERHFIYYSQESHNSNLNIIGSSQELNLEIAQLKQQVELQKEIIQSKNDLIEAQNRELELFRAMFEKQK